MKQLLPKVPKYFRANLHAHTNITDASVSPEEMKAFYKKRGYQILAITDHNVTIDFSHLNEDDFLMLTGAEFNVNEENFDRGCCKSAHFNFIAKRPDILWQPFIYHKQWNAAPYIAKTEVSHISQAHTPEAINAMIAEANRRGYLVMYNHPQWSLHTYEDYSRFKGLWAMEIFNTGSASYGDSDNGNVYRDLVNLGNRLLPVCADDSHNERTVAGGWIMVGARELSYDSVIDALEKGDFYASTGPEIYDLSLEDQQLHIRCSDASAVTIESGLRFATKITATAPDKLLRSGTIDLSKWFVYCQSEDPRKENRCWFRLVVHDAYGKKATTRAFFYDEL